MIGHLYFLSYQYKVIKLINKSLILNIYKIVKKNTIDFFAIKLNFSSDI